MNLTSRKVQKTETVKTRISFSHKGTPFLYFEGKHLIGYIELSPQLIELITENALKTKGDY